jgi:mitochondrial import inner membrane translocase subunit TIM17
MAPKHAKIPGSIAAVTARSPVLGGKFAVWGGLFACCDCSLTAILQKEDPWNFIISGAVTGGVLVARAGPKQMASAAMVGGVLLALIEGVGIMFSRIMAPPVPTAEDYAQAARDVTAPYVFSGWWFVWRRRRRRRRLGLSDFWLEPFVGSTAVVVGPRSCHE